MTGYFSDREQPALPRTVETISSRPWRAILSLINSRLTDGSLGLGFPLRCHDGGAICGSDEASFWDRAVGEIPRLESQMEDAEVARPWARRQQSQTHQWRPTSEEVPPTDAILDLCELIARNIGKPNAIDYHKYFGHSHFRYDKEAGFSDWVQDINLLFARSGLVFEMSSDGLIKRTLPKVLAEMIAQSDFWTGDAGTDFLLDRAIILLTSRDPNAHQDAVEKLWDAFERIKTLEATDKKHGSKALLVASRAANSPVFNDAIEAEFRVLTELGNNLRIRHSEMDKEAVASRREAEYLFQRMFAVLRYVLLQTGRVRRP